MPVNVIAAFALVPIAEVLFPIAVECMKCYCVGPLSDLDLDNDDDMMYDAFFKWNGRIEKRINYGNYKKD